MKKNLLILFFFLAFAHVSQAQPFTGMVYNCYPVVFENQETDYRLACNIEICITQDIECPGCPTSPVETPPPSVTRVTNCFTIDYHYGVTSQVCIWEPTVVGTECDCHVISTSVTFKRVTTGETFSVPTASIPTFLGILNGTMALGMGVGTFMLDCEGNGYPCAVGWELNNGVIHLKVIH